MSTVIRPAGLLDADRLHAVYGVGDMDRAEDVLPPGVVGRLRRRYTEPHRAYHSFAHAAHVAELVHELGGDRPALLAAWFHDAVYEPGAPDNEARSAALLQDWMAGDPDVDEAARLVEVTAAHDADLPDRRAAILCDADLAVLGGDPAAYRRYVAAVRAEYTHLDDDEWRIGRRQVLRTLLARDPLYATAEGRRRWEAAARRNIAAEIEGLG